MIKEDILQFIWRTGFFRRSNLKTTCGKDLRILSPGMQNINAGPDFFNSKIKIGNTLWAGNVEVHRFSSDWVKHEHHLDGAYNNVILHVVTHEDSDTFTSMDRKVDTIQLAIPDSALHFYKVLQTNELWLPCQSHIHLVSDRQMKGWLTRLQTERLNQKCKHISSLHINNKLDWEKTLITVLAAAMGMPLNTLPFELTIKGIPRDILFQNRDSLRDIEALLFGQAGFLNKEQLNGPYDQDLYRRYCRERNKNLTQPIEQHMWKFLRLRPASFPTLRISQFASLLHSRLPLLESILNIRSSSEAEQLLRIESSTYWDTHYLFGRSSSESKKALGQHSIKTVIINGLVPFLFSFGHTMDHLPAISLGNQLLQEADSESNQIIKNWAIFGIVPSGAFESQALIHLHKEYCSKKRCLDCLLGAGFIQKVSNEK